MRKELAIILIVLLLINFTYAQDPVEIESCTIPDKFEGTIKIPEASCPEKIGNFEGLLPGDTIKILGDQYIINDKIKVSKNDKVLISDKEIIINDKIKLPIGTEVEINENNIIIDNQITLPKTVSVETLFNQLVVDGNVYIEKDLPITLTKTGDRTYIQYETYNIQGTGRIDISSDRMYVEDGLINYQVVGISQYSIHGKGIYLDDNTQRGYLSFTMVEGDIKIPARQGIEYSELDKETDSLKKITYIEASKDITCVKKEGGSLSCSYFIDPIAYATSPYIDSVVLTTDKGIIDLKVGRNINFISPNKIQISRSEYLFPISTYVIADAIVNTNDGKTYRIDGDVTLLMGNNNQLVKAFLQARSRIIDVDENIGFSSTREQESDSIDADVKGIPKQKISNTLEIFFSDKDNKEYQRQQYVDSNLDNKAWVNYDDEIDIRSTGLFDFNNYVDANINEPEPIYDQKFVDFGLDLVYGEYVSNIQARIQKNQVTGELSPRKKITLAHYNGKPLITTYNSDGTAVAKYFGEDHELNFDDVSLRYFVLNQNEQKQQITQLAHQYQTTPGGGHPGKTGGTGWRDPGRKAQCAALMQNIYRKADIEYPQQDGSGMCSTHVTTNIERSQMDIGDMVSFSGSANHVAMVAYIREDGEPIYLHSHKGKEFSYNTYDEINSISRYGRGTKTFCRLNEFI
ncbi:NlpC/P60 family protein [Nanoarchaeota archaeon]